MIGVAWPYANGSLHLGHVAGSLLPPDIFARYHRMKGNEVLMVSGSDEHGTPITVTAEKEGLSPQEIVDRYHEEHKTNLKELGITFDLFFRTSHPNHKRVVQEIFLRLLERGYIYKKGVNALFCINCNRFLPDRYVEGTCPHCDFESARGDQCDKCGKTLEPEELIEPKCKLCGSPPELKETEHFFFKLSAFTDSLLEYLKDKTYWKGNVFKFTQNWLRSGLKDRAITRDLSWGVEVPLNGYDDKRIYVWFEAVIGYFSTSKEWARRIGNEDKWKEFWMNEDAKHYYFLGKDNIPFHTIIWPAILMGYGGLNLPYNVPANEYLTLKGEHFSKSRGIAVWLPECLSKFDPDSLRYYLSINMPENRDADFSWEEFYRKNNDELVGTYGNFIHRVLTFTASKIGYIPEMKELKDLDRNALERIEIAYKRVSECIEKCQFKNGLREVMALAHFGNKYFDERAPWSLIKESKEECETVLHICLRIVKALAFLSYPFIPFSAQKVWELLGYDGRIEEQDWEDGMKEIESGRELKKPVPLFKKIEYEKELKAEIETKMIKKSAVDLDVFSKLDLRVALIKDVEEHPNADKLYVLRVDLGTEERQLVAGLKDYYKKEELKGRKIIVITNLKPTKLRGVESQGMLLAAEDGKDVSLLVLDKDLPPGSKVR